MVLIKNILKWITSMKPQTVCMVLVIIGAISIWIITWVLTTCMIACPAERGMFGDMFGSVNSLFSGLAFIGVIWALLLQREQLQLQENEVKQNTTQLIEQSKIMKNEIAVSSTSARLQALPDLINKSDGDVRAQWLTT